MICRFCGGNIKRTGIATGECEDCSQPYAGIIWSEGDDPFKGALLNYKSPDIRPASKKEIKKRMTSARKAREGPCRRGGVGMTYVYMSDRLKKGCPHRLGHVFRKDCIIDELDETIRTLETELAQLRKSHREEESE